MDEAVTIKGTRDGLVISLGEGPWEAVVAEMELRLGARASFFLGGRVALRVANRALSLEQIQAVGSAVEKVGMTLWAVEGDHPSTHLAAREAGLEVSLSAAAAAPGASAAAGEGLPALVVRRTLRSGQELHFAGHVTVIGDVNPGAHVVAGGDLVVWGRVRGYVHAGALGDDEAVVCALQLAPSQIRIGSFIAQAPERGRLPKHPEIARVHQGDIVVERWDRKT